MAGKKGYHRKGGKIDKKQWEAMLTLKNAGVAEKMIAEITGWARPSVHAVLRFPSFEAYEDHKQEYAKRMLEKRDVPPMDTPKTNGIPAIGNPVSNDLERLFDVLVDIRDLLQKRRIF